MAKSNLKSAKENKVDEFYTQLVDIEKELRHYKEYFKNKIILCNCDDPFESNFFKYFAMNFKHLQIKKLIATSYAESPIAYTQLSLFEDDNAENQIKSDKKPYKIIINDIDDINNDGAFDLIDIQELLKSSQNNVLTVLKGDGDFRSDEIVELLRESDIVVTNPPFSLFREYVSQLVEYEKKFIIIGNTNALGYKEIFKLFKDDQMSTGYTNFNKGMFFQVPDHWEKYSKIIDGKKHVRVSTSCWFTNFEIKKHNELITLYKQYSPEEYLRYENFEAINVDKVADIPYDYNGYIGVPITFLDKYNPKQFEIIGLGIANLGLEIGVQPYKSEHKKFRKEIQKRGAVDGDLYMMIDGVVTVPYSRIIIKKRG